MFDPIIIQLIEKLADGNQRIRDGSRKGLEILAAASTCIGPGIVAHYGVKALSSKQKTAWRPISARLQLLYDLVITYGIGGNTGLNVDSILSFPKSHGAYTHSTAEVRDDAKKLIVAIQKCAGTPAIESVLKLLRPKQLEEYQQAFDGSDVKTGPSSSNPTSNNNNNNNAPSKDSNNNKKKDLQTESPSRTDKHLQHTPHMPGGKVQTSAAKVSNPSVNGTNNKSHGLGMKASGGNHNIGQHDNGSGEDQQDFTSCMFCGVRDKNWTENDLDVHYWKDCPLLISCPSCAQIVEIAGMCVYIFV